MTLGQRLRHLRERADLTQRDLARLAEISHGTVNNIEHGTRADPASSVLHRLAKALGVTMEYLLTGEPVKE